MSKVVTKTLSKENLLKAVEQFISPMYSGEEIAVVGFKTTPQGYSFDIHIGTKAD